MVISNIINNVINYKILKAVIPVAPKAKPISMKMSESQMKLKDYFEKQGVKYLLPNECWSNRDITKTVDALSPKIDELIESGHITPKAVQTLIEKGIPQLTGKFKIKDFSEYNAILRANGKEALINENIAGSTVPMENGDYNLYLRFGDVYKKPLFGNPRNVSIKRNLLFKVTVEHELTHLLQCLCQNPSRLKIKHEQNISLIELFVNMEKYWENNCSNPLKDRFGKISVKNKLNKIGFETNKTCGTNLLSEMNLLITDKILEKKFHPNITIKTKKEFYYIMENLAKAEKNAYKTEKLFKNLFPNIDLSLSSFRYKKMEQFFAQQKNSQNPFWPKF